LYYGIQRVQAADVGLAEHDGDVFANDALGTSSGCD
jgi:hypothetical protein